MTSKPLVVTVSSADVLEQDYQVVQQNEVGNFEFSQVDVGFRSDASHELVFEDGFLFAEKRTTTLLIVTGARGLQADHFILECRRLAVGIGRSYSSGAHRTEHLQRVVYDRDRSSRLSSRMSRAPDNAESPTIAQHGSTRAF